MTTASVLVSIDSETDINDLVDAGLEVRSVLHRLGIVTGTLDFDDFARLRRVPGVRAVEVEQTVYGAE